MLSRRMLLSNAGSATLLGVLSFAPANAFQSIEPIADFPPDYDDDALKQIFADNAEPLAVDGQDYVVKGLGDWPLWWDDTPLEMAQWPARENAVDYAHLPDADENEPFLLSDAALRRIVDSHAYSRLVTESGLVLFGVRGAKRKDNAPSRIAFETQVELVEAMPDHFDYKCLLGVWDIRNKKVTAIAASTVPHVAYLYAQREAGTFANESNMMPTGLYRYAVGTHRNRSSSAQPGAFRPASRAFAVLRCLTEGPIAMSRDKYWDMRASNHGDNIHAGTYSTRADRPKFWSAGCQVTPGYYSDNDSVPQGDWARFRVAAGLKRTPSFTKRIEVAPGKFDTATTEDGRLYSYILTTGRDVRLAAANESEPVLRFGSYGNKVKALQAALGAPTAAQDGIFGLGTQTLVLESGLAGAPIVDRKVASELGVEL